MKPASFYLCTLLLVYLGAAFCYEASAQSKAQIVSDLIEFLGRRFGKEVAEESPDILARKVESIVVKYGDDGAEALRKIGPRTIALLDGVADEGAQSARLLAKFGDEAVWVVSNPGRRTLASQLGDDAAEAMIKHGEIVEPILQSSGQSAASALRTVSNQNARRIAMMAKDGELAKLPRTSELFAVMGKYGDSAAEFVWKNKGTLMLGTAMAAFLTDPEPFLNGTRELADIAAKSAIEPIAKEIGSRTNWTLTIVALAGCLAIYMLVKAWLKRPRT
jgi:hypothetical protein